MKVTKTELKQIIKEELEAVMDEKQLDELFPAARKYYRDTLGQTDDSLDRETRRVEQSLRILNDYDGPYGIKIHKDRDGTAEVDIRDIVAVRKLLTALWPIRPYLAAIGASTDRPKAGLFNQWQEEYEKSIKAITDGLAAIQNHPSNLVPEPDIDRGDFSPQGYKTDRKTSQKEGLPEPVPREPFSELMILLKRAQKMVPKFRQGISKKDIYKTKAYEPDDESKDQQ